jgi:hypothetical protein
MTTVVDPFGTPVPIYNRSGATIIELTAGTASPFDPTPIIRHTGTTIALVTTISSGDQTYVTLPDDADIGDLVEVHCMGAVAVNVLVPTGGPLDSVEAAPNHSVVFRKTSSTDPRTWRRVGA